MNTLSVQIADNDVKNDAVMKRVMSNMFCACFAIVQSVNYENQTLEAIPTIRRKCKNKDGTVTNIDLDPLLDVPFQCPSGGGFVATFPVKPNDEVLIVFTDVDYSAWWQNGGIQNTEHQFKHNMCNAVALIGYRSEPNSIPNYNANGVELRNNDGTEFISMQSGLIALKTDTINLTANSININGATVVTGTLNTTDTTTIQGKEFLPHTHTTTTEGSPTSGVN